MNKIFTKRPLVKTGIFGFLLLPFLILINEFSPSIDKVPQGYSSSILAFEFASNQEELEEVLLPLTDKEKKDLDSLNYVDFGFMVIYGVFLFLFMARFGSLINSPLLSKFKWLAPLIVIFDALENAQLLSLTNSLLNAQAIEQAILFLGIFTWLKWGLLSLVFLLIGFVMTKMNLSKWIGYVFFIPFLLGVISFITGLRRLEDIFATSIFLAFFMLFIYCFTYKRSPQNA